MQQATKDNLANRNIWARGLYMLFYVIAYAVAETIASLVALFQFVHALVTGRVNEPLQIFGARLSTYIFQILQYVTFNSEYQPFPFSEWPDVGAGDTPWSASATEAPMDEQPAADRSGQTATTHALEESPETKGDLDQK